MLASWVVVTAGRCDVAVVEDDDFIDAEDGKGTGDLTCQERLEFGGLCTVVNSLVGCSVWTEGDPLTLRQCFQAAQCSAYTCALPWLRRRRWASRYPLRSPRVGRIHACVSNMCLAEYERRWHGRNLHLGFHGRYRYCLSSIKII